MTPQEKIALTPEQEKAFKSFKRAYKKCKKSGIEFYTILESIYALNGEHLIRVHDGDGRKDLCLQGLRNDSIFDTGFSGWADDTHYAEVRE